MRKAVTLARDSRNSVLQVSAYRTGLAQNITTGGSISYPTDDIIRVANIGTSIGYLETLTVDQVVPDVTASSANVVFVAEAMVYVGDRNGAPFYKGPTGNDTLKFNGTAWELYSAYDQKTLVAQGSAGTPPLSGYSYDSDGTILVATIALGATPASVSGDGMALAVGESLHLRVEAGGLVRGTGDFNITSLGA